MADGEQARTAWSDLPEDLRRTVDALLDGPVTDAISQTNGFSPGSADRVVTASGRRAFVKAVSRERNSYAYDLHHRELKVMGALPSAVRAPRLLGFYDRDDWVALVLEDVPGRHPGGVVAGDHLVHLDCRADNLLVDDSGRAWIIDWPWACVGARWLDGLTYLLDARLRGEVIDADGIVRGHELFAGVPPSSIDPVLAGLTGLFFNRARLPAPPNMPTIRDFQLSEALAGAAWLRERWRD